MFQDLIPYRNRLRSLFSTQDSYECSRTVKVAFRLDRKRQQVSKLFQLFVLLSISLDDLQSQVSLNSTVPVTYQLPAITLCHHPKNFSPLDGGRMLGKPLVECLASGLCQQGDLILGRNNIPFHQSAQLLPLLFKSLRCSFIIIATGCQLRQHKEIPLTDRQGDAID